MKILLLIGDITLGGGAERVVCNLANGFNALGHDVEIKFLQRWRKITL